MVLVLPYDAILWLVPHLTHLVPWLRLLRVVPAVQSLGKLLGLLERSQVIEFVLSRTLRILLSFFFVIHWLGCAFFGFSIVDNASYFGEAPWMVDLAATADGNVTDYEGARARARAHTHVPARVARYAAEHDRTSPRAPSRPARSLSTQQTTPPRHSGPTSLHPH